MSGLLGIDYAPSDSDSTPVPAAADASVLVAYCDDEAEASPAHDAPPAIVVEVTEPAEAEDPAAPIVTSPSNGLVPPSPTGPVDPELQARVQKLWANSRNGEINFNNHLRKSKLFRNPEILEKLVEQQALDASGTSYSSDIFDPTVSDKGWYHDAIYKQQNYMLQKQAEKKEAAKLAKQSVTTKVLGPAVTLSRQTSASSQGGDKKRTKWDQN